MILAALLLLALPPAPGRAQAWALKTLIKSPRHGEWVTIKSGGRDLSAFVVYPEVAKKAPS